jgi:hypothetical protein
MLLKQENRRMLVEERVKVEGMLDFEKTKE